MKGYDVCIGCCFNKTSLCIINPDLLKDYFNAPLGTYVKFRPVLEYFDKIIKNTVGFSEGSDWKKKRKIFSQVFHYDFIKQLIPTGKTIF
jgi:hypothetical protein